MLCSIGYIWCPYAFLSYCRLVDPLLPLVAIWHFKAILPLVEPSWPCKTFDPSMHYTLVWGPFYQFWRLQGIFKEFDPQVDPGWPVHDLWPQQCITLWSGILPTKFGGHRAFLSNVTPGWPRITPAWPLTPAMHYTLVRGSSHQIWWP